MSSPEIQKLTASVEHLNGVIEIKATQLAARIESVKEDGEFRGRQIEAIALRLESYDFNKNGGSTKDRVARLEGFVKWLQWAGGATFVLVVGGFVSLWFKGVEANRTAATMVATQQAAAATQKAAADELKTVINAVMDERAAKLTVEYAEQPKPVPRRRGKPKPPLTPREVNSLRAKRQEQLAGRFEHNWAILPVPDEQIPTKVR
jgi:hypothetical protein